MGVYKSLLGKVTLKPGERDLVTGYDVDIAFRHGIYIPGLAGTWGLSNFVETNGTERDALKILRERENLREEARVVIKSVSDGFLKRKLLNLYRYFQFYGSPL
jgi:hypothetical protein